uniref:uncharacterized protein LOC101299716 isoform X1 n=1 Tax=Fragaria vesca subsp. vesca TaxID=101020 RepID=UPI0005C88C02|nr:PREDICTED: uncharacterized protein LOC101299716 isoform X1 [Fragaria vesca subsp. vesca]
MKSLGGNGSSGRLSMEENEDEETSRLAISTFQAREEEIERKKMEVKERVELQLGRAEEETRRLAQIWEELEALSDPNRKELANVRKKIDMVNRELKPLGLGCQKKVLHSLLFSENVLSRFHLLIHNKTSQLQNEYNIRCFAYLTEQIIN